MNINPECSVVIPTLNCLEYLPAAIRSVQAQDVDAIEIMVIDDGSTDGTQEWLAAEAARDPRIVVFNTERKGPSYTRNVAIFRARAPIVAFLDADDAWRPGKLRRALAFHEATPAVAFSFTDYLAVGESGDERGTCFGYWRPDYADPQTPDFAIVRDAELELLAANVVGTSTVVASRKALQNANGFAMVSRSAEDWDLWLRLAARGPVACSSETTMIYLMRASGVTGNKSARIDSMRKIIAPYRSMTGEKARWAWKRAAARIDEAEAEQAKAEGDNWGAARGHVAALLKWPQARTAHAVMADVFAACKGAS